MSRDGKLDLSVRRAVAADAAALGVVGPAAYVQAYDYLWSEPAALAAHLESFSAGAFARLLAQGDTALWVAEQEDRIIGYLTLHLRSACPINPADNDAELRRIYLLPPARGRGLAEKMVHAAAAYAEQRGATRLWLDVMRSAVKVQESYRSWGFVAVGTATFDHGVRPEFAEVAVMCRTLAPPAASSGEKTR